MAKEKKKNRQYNGKGEEEKIQRIVCSSSL
jgi:hypothetical protein